jgi:predicted metal-dependent HD superfamily phosphohydrolase
MTSPKLQRWLSLCDEVGCLGSTEDFHRLIRSWKSFGRRYHSLGHLSACLREFDQVRSLAERPGEVEMALWYHDAIYRTWRADNELRSADWAARDMQRCGADAEAIARVHALVMATRHDAAVLQADAALMGDVDLSILGQPPTVYDQFERDIRREYWWVPRKRYMAARVEVLQGFLARPKVFHFDAFVERYEERARENLTGAIGALGE